MSASDLWAAYRAEAIDSRLFVIRRLHLGGRGACAALLACNLATGLMPIGFVVAMSVLVGRIPAAVSHGVDSPQWGALVSAFLIASACFFGQQLLAPAVVSLGSVMRHRVNGSFRSRMIDLSLRTRGVAALEDKDALDELRSAAERLETAWMSPGDAAAGTLAYISRYTSVLAYIALIGFASSWPAALAVLACTACFRYGHRSGLRLYTRVWPVTGPLRRRREYLRDLGIRAEAAKELRVFGLAGWISEQYREAALAHLEPLRRERRRVVLRRFLYFTVAGFGLAGGALAELLRLGAEGHVSLTGVALSLQAAVAAIGLGDYYAEADNQAQFGMIAGTAMERFAGHVARYAAAEEATQNTDAVSARAAAGLPLREIAFEGVGFGYPGADRAVLDGLDLTLRAGECTALVGVNGAGKTTLVKLLARLYEPDRGRLLVDGRPVDEFDVASWRAQLAVIFQGFNRYELTAAENIAFAAGRPAEAEAVRRAARRAGVLDALETLPDGLDTVLAGHYERGSDLSGGQWQRVAIARALYALDHGARVLVMDEPTSALDVRAETEFFEQFQELTRGVTSLLISHRFSSVRRADRIIVLEHGRVLEEGTHESLMARDGRYAHLFRLQAQRFADGAEGTADVDDFEDEEEGGER